MMKQNRSGGVIKTEWFTSPGESIEVQGGVSATTQIHRLERHVLTPNQKKENVKWK
jgi:hypothetical protein